ncbi:hypothetical protein [Spirillospora sp. NPDC047279]|uniref:hypothetical protein n=1 Tax=Spirillospora sp. NPDC047279 TaxID=3155478 RepID=UPI0033EA1EE3
MKTKIGSEPETAEDTAPADATAEDDAATEAGAEDESAESGPAGATAPEPSTRRRDPVVLVAMVVTAIAALAAAWFGWSGYAASQDDSLSYARERDRVLSSAEQGIVNLNTLDHRDIDGGLRLWQDSTTAELYDGIAKGRTELEREVTKGRTSTTAKVVESGLTELDTHAGKAAVIVAVRITVTPAEGRASSKISRLTGQLTKTAEGWKLSALGVAPTGTGS